MTTVYSLTAKNISLVPGVTYALSDVYTVSQSTVSGSFTTAGASIHFGELAPNVLSFPGLATPAGGFNVNLGGSPLVSTVGTLSSIHFVFNPTAFSDVGTFAQTAAASLWFDTDATVVNDTVTQRGSKDTYVTFVKDSSVTISSTGYIPPVPAANWLQSNYDKVINFFQAIDPFGTSTALGNLSASKDYASVLRALAADATIDAIGVLTRVGGVVISAGTQALDPQVAQGSKALHDSITDPNSSTRGLMNQTENAQLRAVFAELDSQAGVKAATPVSKSGNKSTFSVPVTQGQVAPVDPAVSYGELYDAGVNGPLFASVVTPALGSGNTSLALYTKAADGTWKQTATLTPFKEYTFAAPLQTFLIAGIDTTKLAVGTEWVSGVSFASSGTFSGSITTLSQSDVATLLPRGSTLPSGTGTATVTVGTTTTTIAEGQTISTTQAGSVVRLNSSANPVVSNGRDTIYGGTATAKVTIASGATVFGSTGAITVQGGNAASTVIAGKGPLIYTGGSGTDVVAAHGAQANITGGTGGGLFQGGGNATMTAGAGGSLNVEFGSNGDQMYASGPGGVLFGDSGGDSSRDTLMDSSKDTGNSVFFGASGSGRMTFITGSGNDLLAVGQGTNIVRLGSGSDIVLANTPAAGNTTIYVGDGNATIAMGGLSTTVVIAPHVSRSIALYGDTGGTNKISLGAYPASEMTAALANQVQVGGGTQLTLSDGSVLSLVGVQRATMDLFA